MARTHIQFQNQIISIVYNEKKRKNKNCGLLQSCCTVFNFKTAP